MLNFFRKKSEEISRTEPGFEETERRTPKTGVILLIIMFVAGMWFGWVALDDLARVPSSPEPLSHCASRYYESIFSPKYEPAVRSPIAEPYHTEKYYYFDDSSSCEFSDLEKELGVADLINKKRKPLENNLKRISESLVPLERDLDEARQKRIDAENRYNLYLQEKQAGVQDKIYQIGVPTQEAIRILRNEESTLAERVLSYQKDIESKGKEVKAVDEELKIAYKQVFEAQEKRSRWYEFKVFLLQFLVVLPIFLLALRQYFRLHAKNSPYAVIFTGIVAVTGILALRVILFWFWGLFLARLIETLWRWIQSVQLVRSLVFYSGMMLSFVLFGGAVYYLQKKIFDPRRVAIRRFRANQCPRCQTSLDLADTHCPNCGELVREKCEVCGGFRFSGLPACPHCGNKKEI